MDTSRPLPRGPKSLLGIAPLQPKHLIIRLSRELRWAPKTGQDRTIIRRQIIHDIELLDAEPSRHNPHSERNQGNDQNREPNRRNRLRDGHRRGDAQRLTGNIQRDLAPSNSQERLVALDEAVLAREKDQFLEDAVGLDRAPADGEKDACKDGGRHCVQDDQQRASHGADDEQAHEEVGDALLDDGGGGYDWTADFGAFAFGGGDGAKGGFVNG